MDILTLGLLGAASTAIIVFMSASLSCVGRAEPAVTGGEAYSSSALERMAGSERSKGLGKEGERSSCHHVQGANPDHLESLSMLGGGASDRGEHWGCLS